MREMNHSRVGIVIPDSLKRDVYIRDNVEENIKSLSLTEQRDFWRCISEIVQTSIFNVEDKLDSKIRITTRDGVAIFGTVIKSAFITIVRIIDRRLTIMSVIGMRRLRRSTKSVACALIDEWLRGVDTLEHVFAAIDENKRIVWTHESRSRAGNLRVTFVGEIIEPVL